MTNIDDIKSKSIENLDTAKRICFKANESLTNSFNTAKKKDTLTEELREIIISIKNHFQIFLSLKDLITQSVVETEDKKTKILTDSKHSLGLLDKTLDSLKSIIVEPSLNPDRRTGTSSEHLEKQKTLYDFIDTDTLNIKVIDIENNVKIVEYILDSKTVENLKFRLDKQSKQLFIELENMDKFSRKFIVDQSMNNKIDDIIRNNSELEVEIIDILKQLNTHLDNCISYQSDNSNDSLLEEIMNFQLRSTSLMALLENHCDVIFQNDRDLSNILDFYHEFKGKLRKCLLQIDEFISSVLEKQVQNNLLVNDKKCLSCLEIISKETSQVSEFINDSEEFIKSYYSLILEMNRRKALNYKVRNLIDNFEADLKTLQNEDHITRRKFLEEHADYLPNDLVDPGLINSKFPTIEFSYALENLPTIKNSSVEQSMYMLKNKSKIG